MRGSGGFGGQEGNTAPQVYAPEAAPDHEVTYQTRPDQALTYRLSGDYNPLHSDPWFATELGGFPKAHIAWSLHLWIYWPSATPRTMWK